MAKRKPASGPRVFLSHSTRDQWISERLKEKLEEVGVEVWLDAFDLPGGRNVKERIKEGMRSSTECLILLSAASRESDWVKHEAGLADAYGKPTVLVLLHVGDDDVPDPLRDLKFFDINEFPGYVRHLATLARRKEERTMNTARAAGSVFISHSHQDNELVRDLARRLRGAGLEPIVDFADLPSASDWKKTVRELGFCKVKPRTVATWNGIIVCMERIMSREPQVSNDVFLVPRTDGSPFHSPGQGRA